METRYFLATHDGITRPVDDRDEIALLIAHAAPTLTATANASKVDVKVFFPQPMEQSLMQQALRAVIQIADNIIPLGATSEQILFFVKANWKDLAFNAYKNFRTVGRGCFFFPEGIQDKDSFPQIPREYVPRDQFMQNPTFKLSRHMMDMYDPDTSVFIFIQQKSSFWFVAGVNYALPAPKSIWEEFKDDPTLSSLIMSLLL